MCTATLHGFLTTDIFSERQISEDCRFKAATLTLTSTGPLWRLGRHTCHAQWPQRPHNRLPLFIAPGYLWQPSEYFKWPEALSLDEHALASYRCYIMSSHL